MRWFLAVIAILIVSLILESGLLALAAYVLLAILFLSRFMARNWIGSLTATRECDQITGEIGQKVPVKVKVKNESWLPAPWVLMEDLLPQAHGLTPEGMGGPRLKIIKGRRIRLSMLWPGRQVALEYTLELRMRGYYQIGPLVLESGDLFGLHRRYRAVTEPHFLLVYPKVVPLQGYELASRRPVGEIRLAHRLFEDPTRIAGVRQYQRGDPLNRETLGRIELSDGLTFAQLVLEATDRLPRDATVLAVLAEVSVETALALGNLRRQGYTVSVVLILIADEQFEQTFGRLMAEGITDIRHLRDEQGLPTLCLHQAMRATPYLISVELA